MPITIICDRCEEHVDVDLVDEEGVCKNCRQDQAEAAYERLCEDFHDGGSTAPWPETVRMRQEEARKLK